jgi:hypothetical protein
MTTDVNVLIRGQSNALLFVAGGGASTLEHQLEAKLGDVNVHILAQYYEDDSTIYSGTAFLDWDTDGEQQGLINFLKAQSADIKDNPTVTLWMHNEYDSNTYGVTTDHWVSEVTEDAVLVRSALAQDSATTPYVFTYVPYNYTQGNSPEAIQAGMQELSADSRFNASYADTAMEGIAMDGDGYSNSSHMGSTDAITIGERLADWMADTVSALARGGSDTGAGGTDDGDTGGSTGGGTTPPPVSGGTVFYFNAVADSPTWAQQMLDWHAGDKIDLSDVPLIGKGRPSALHWAGVDSDGSDQVYGVWQWGDGSGTVRADVTGDGLADMSFVLQGAPTLTAFDLILATAGTSTGNPSSGGTVGEIGGGQTGKGTVFDFNTVVDSPKWAQRTLDWHAGDKIDLSDVPLTGKGRPSALHWAGVDPDGSDQVYGVWQWGDGSGTVRADVTGDGLADMSFVLQGVPTLTAFDLILA